MARKTTADAAKDKAAKQKKIVIGLAVFLALAMAYAIHTMSSLGGPPAGSSKPQGVAAGAITTPAPTPDASTAAAPSLAGSTTPAATPAAPTSTAAGSSDSSKLVAILTPTADPGQLDSFSRFESKDPFAAAGSSSGSGGSSGTKGSSGSGATPANPPTPPAPPPADAVISVNGSSEMVQNGASFPVANAVATTNGLFQLVSLTATTATVSVVGGSYASGSQTLTLKVNKPVTLVNTGDGTRYTLLLYPQGTAAPSTAPSTGGTSTTSTPTSTTPSTGG